MKQTDLARAQLSFTEEITVDGFCGGGGWSNGRNSDLLIFSPKIITDI